jgi:hypothetical protein
MQPPTLEQLAHLEARFSICFPPSYRALIAAVPASVRRLFPRARFIATDDDLRTARVHLPPTLLPFLVDPQPPHDDYYGFELSMAAPEYGVAVFAIHTTVAAWPDLAAWLRWVEDRGG